jgi:hypothetical protein
LLVAAGCGAPDQAPRDAATPAARTVPSRAPAQLERTFTGQAQPTIRVRNAFPVTQHVFIDGKHAGKAAPHSSLTLGVALGTHTLTAADSADPDDNPVSITEIFETGFSYTYEILPE